MVKDIDDYLDYLHEEYPDISKSVLREVITKGLKQLQHLLYADLDVSIKNHTPLRNYAMTIVRPMNTWEQVKSRAKEKYYQLQRRRAKRKCQNQ
jgi:hypothetical protein